ncbi:MAG: protein kinase [Proteobacteria bacterium]|nr:protein kinase [Pseudomonadota bacterium]
MKNRLHHKESTHLQVKSSEPTPLASEFTLPGYTLVKPLGHGSQGKVFLTRRQSDGKEVAVKRLNIESVKTWKSYELFHREAEVLKKLHIDGIATFYDAFDRLDDDPPCAYILQEYIPGDTLASLIKAGHRLSIDRVYDIIIQMLKILKQLHEHTPPIIHRDIKPSNIILKPLEGDTFKVCLVDFGAVSNPQLQGGGSTVAGTYGFMPPEQLMGKPVPQSDIYALAAVAVNLITGKSPADMPVKDFHLIFEPEMQFMPVQVVDVLRRMLDPNVENRLFDFDDLIHTFEQFRLGNYDNSNSPSSSLSSSNYENELQNVMSYAQPGNIDLWQQIPDKREVPNCYCKAFQSKENEDTLYFGTDSSIYAKQYDIVKRSLNEQYQIHNNSRPGLLGKLGTLYFVFMLILLIVLAIWVFLLGLGISSSSNIFITVLIIFIFLCIFPNSPFFLLKHYKSKRTAIHYHFNTKDDDENLRRSLLETIETGRKTIATIVSIEYLNVDDEFCEENLKTKQFAVHQKPSFKVKYSFNPPDDCDPNDLVHEIVIHEDPMTVLKVGDPLPILYRIHRVGLVDAVYSTPFPIVLSDVEHIQEIMGCSKYIP